MKLTSYFSKTLLVLGIMTLTYSCEEEKENGDVTTDSEILESVSVNTILDATKIYVVESAVQVNASLTIPAGTIIKFKQDSRIDVHAGGFILAQGTLLKPIIFTSIKDDLFGGDTNGDKSNSAPAPKDWGCITNWSDNSVFSYCHFYYGGGFGDHTATLDISGCLTNVTYCTFGFNFGGELDDNTNGALCIKEAKLASAINNNTFYGNDIPMCIDVNFNMDTTNVFHMPGNINIKNKYNGIFVDHYSSTNDVVWEENEVPFVLISNMGIEDGASLTLNTDVVLKMFLDTRIDILETGVLNHNEAIITSFRDDAVLGDTNGDNNLTVPVAGDWVGINLGYGNYITGSNIKYSTY